MRKFRIAIIEKTENFRTVIAFLIKAKCSRVEVFTFKTPDEFLVSGLVVDLVVCDEVYAICDRCPFPEKTKRRYIVVVLSVKDGQSETIRCQTYCRSHIENLLILIHELEAFFFRINSSLC